MPMCQQARDDAGRGRAEAPGHRDGVGLDELEGRHGLADLIEQTLGRAVDQIGLAAGGKPLRRTPLPER